jgi:hypothetical protein
MKPVNANLGAAPLGVSRPSSLDVQDKQYNFVSFQQSKSILDFDLNAMQNTLQSSIQKLTKFIYSQSGFVSVPNISYVSSWIWEMPDSR